MNSLQLISKIRSKADDITHNIHEILAASSSLNAIEKELLKKQCLDLYELLMKLKTEADMEPDKTMAPPVPVEMPKPKIQMSRPAETPQPPPIEAPVPTAEPEPQPILHADTFKEVLNWADKHEETLDAIEQKVEIADLGVKHVIETAPVEPKKESNESPIEVNVEKATENKRIQYTVMPPVEENKTVPLNAIFADKESTYNDRLAQKLQPNHVPLAEQTVEARIENLKTAISLNKKIAYVNELFKENVVEYAKAIDRLNNALSLAEALNIFNELKITNHWQDSSELVQELEKLIRRRHI